MRLQLEEGDRQVEKMIADASKQRVPGPAAKPDTPIMDAVLKHGDELARKNHTPAVTNRNGGKTSI